jgi:hypothetical protein
MLDHNEAFVVEDSKVKLLALGKVIGRLELVLPTGFGSDSNLGK